MNCPFCKKEIVVDHTRTMNICSGGCKSDLRFTMLKDSMLHCLWTELDDKTQETKVLFVIFDRFGNSVIPVREEAIYKILEEEKQIANN